MAGGPTKEVSLKGRTHTCTGDAAPTLQFGGVENDHMPNGYKVTARTIKTPVKWSISSLAIELDTSRNDHEFLQECQEGDDFDIALTYMDDTVYVGTGNLEGELNAEPASASTTIELAGPGKLKKLSQ